MKETGETHAPIRQSVRVECPIEDAFRLFTERFTEWWPLATHSVAGQDAGECAIEPWVGGRIFERTRSGEEHDWGSVVDWNPPRQLKFSWHPGRDRDTGQTVEIGFRVEADGTRVTLIHTGWQQESAGIQNNAIRSQCSARWSAALNSCFSAFVCEQVLAAR